MDLLIQFVKVILRIAIVFCEVDQKCLISTLEDFIDRSPGRFCIRRCFSLSIGLKI